MFRILTNEVFALNRRHARIARHEFQLEPEELEALAISEQAGSFEADPLEPGALTDALDQDLAMALKTLTDAERAVLLLRAIGGLRYSEISASLDIPLGSVMGYLARARQKMRRAIARCAPNANPPFKELP
jgi:RNA polymerase sigma-70 factor (ECF subfamily)